jgi:hypothetical protein
LGEFVDSQADQGLTLRGTRAGSDRKKEGKGPIYSERTESSKSPDNSPDNPKSNDGSQTDRLEERGGQDSESSGFLGEDRAVLGLRKAVGRISRAIRRDENERGGERKMRRVYQDKKRSSHCDEGIGKMTKGEERSRGDERYRWGVASP